MRKLILAIGLLAILSGCASEEYQKTEGQVVSKYVGSGRGGDYYDIRITYKNSKGNYVIDYVSVSKESYDTYKSGQVVTILANDGGIGGVIKEGQ